MPGSLPSPETGMLRRAMAALGHADLSLRLGEFPVALAATGGLQSRQGAFPNGFALEPGQCGKDAERQSADSCCRVNLRPLAGKDFQASAAPGKRRYRFHGMAQAPAHAIRFPDRRDIAAPQLSGRPVTLEGRPLGLFTMNATFRDSPGADSRRWVDGIDQAEELAKACPGTSVVSVCDHEGDFRELLAHAASCAAALLVRAAAGRTPESGARGSMSPPCRP